VNRRVRSFRAKSRNAHSPAPKPLFDFARSERKWVALISTIALATPTEAAEPTTYQRALAAGYKAAFLCSGMFNAGRTREQIEALELTGIYPDYQPLMATLPAQVNGRQVSVSFDAELPPRVSYWRPGLGCSTLPIGAAPPAEGSAPAPPHGAEPRPWPMGDAGIRPKPSSALTAHVSAAFSGSYGDKARTVGVVIVHDGRVVAERYAEGFGPFTSNRTWSVAKSITGTLAGIAVHKDLLRADALAPIPEWRTPGDPRAAITLDQLLRMASGLHSDTAGNRTDALYTGATTVTQEATHWPLEAAPGSRFRYANNDTLLAVRAIRATLNDDQAYLSFPRAALFEKIGMRHTVAETDWQNNFILSSQVWSTARDLARLGLLWLNDGVWAGKRLLAEGWVKYMATPSGPQPAQGEGYGATLWLFGPKQGLPEGSYGAQGNRGQYIMVVPSKRLVIVRRGEDPAGGGFDIEKFSADVLKAIE
jgi:CubicO group peptidase (beta-lactamase class C family)